MKLKLPPSVACLVFLFLGVCCLAAGQASAPVANATPHSNIQIENWARPQRGWLYILDPKPDSGGQGGRVWLVDPESGKVMGSIRTGDNPDFALSPDGSHLYIASAADGDSSELALIDTAQGVVLKSGMVGSRATAPGLPGFSTMSVSGDGLVLRILIDTPKPPDKDDFLLASFDTQAGEFLPGVVHLYNCGPGRFITHAAAGHFDFLCPRTNRIRFISVDADSREVRNVDVVFPWERREGIGVAFEIPGSPGVDIVRGDGGIVQMNPATLQVEETLVHAGAPNRVPPAAWPLSPDGSKLYLGYQHDYDRHADNRFYLDYGRPPNVRPNDSTVDEFHVFDTHTWKKIHTIRTKMAFWSAAIGGDGKMLYALAPQKHSILVIDTEKMREIRALKVGGAPTLAIVAP